MNCFSCTKSIDIVRKRQRNEYHVVFCSKECCATNKLTTCQNCSKEIPLTGFKIRKSVKGFFYVSSTCLSCRQKIKKVIIILLSRETLTHTGISYFDIRDGVLEIRSEEDSKNYYYPLSNILKVEELF